MRSTEVFILSLCFFGSAMLTSLLSLFSPPATAGGLISIQVTLVLDIAAGIITLFYWAWWRSDYSAAERPLGVTILALEIGLVGLVLMGEGFLLLLLPIVGIIGVFLGGLGLGLFFLARGLWNGKEWSVEIVFVLTVIGIVIGVVLLILSGTGTPILAVFQLWYLRRPHLRRFFYGSLNTTTPSRGYGPSRVHGTGGQGNQSFSPVSPIETGVSSV